MDEYWDDLMGRAHKYILSPHPIKRSTLLMQRFRIKT